MSNHCKMLRAALKDEKTAYTKDYPELENKEFGHPEHKETLRNIAKDEERHYKEVLEIAKYHGCVCDDEL